MDYLQQLFSDVYFMVPSAGAVFAGLLACLLLVVSGFASGSEMAFFSLSPTDLNEIAESDAKCDRQIRELREDSERTLATILITNNLVNVTIIMLSNYFFANVIHFGNAVWLQFLVITVLLTFLLLLFGEIIPKIYCAQHALAVCRSFAGSIMVLRRLFRPLSSILIRSGILAEKVVQTENHVLSVDDLEQALELTDKSDLKEEQNMLEGIVRFGDETAKEIMTSRQDVVALDFRSPFTEVLQSIVENNYSRIPVYQNSIDNVRGILYIKDLLPHLSKPATFRWQSLIRPPYFVPETKKIDDLMREFQANKVHIAIVVDEFGGTSGLVSLEDIMEEITGEIEDEHDNSTHVARQIADGEYMLSARLEIEKINEMFSLDLPESDEYMTLGGLILHEYQSFPKLNEIVRIGNYECKIVKNTATKIELVRLKVIE